MLSDLRSRSIFRTISLIIPLIAFLFFNGELYAQATDQFKLVNRHNLLVRKMDPLTPLSVGNGDFIFTADVTGLQSFEQIYHQNGNSLQTMSSWARYSFPYPQRTVENTTKQVGLQGHQTANTKPENSDNTALEQNLSPLPLGQISLVKRDNNSIDPSSLSNINQKLDLWRGVITSSYRLSGHPVLVETVSSPDKSIVAFSLISPLLKRSSIKTSFRFPYSYDLTTKNNPSLDWSKPDMHTTDIVKSSKNSVLLKRSIGETTYYVGLSWKGDATFIEVANHQFYLETAGDKVEVVCEFSPTPINKVQPGFAKVKQASEESWKEYWTKNAAIDVPNLTNSRNQELERQLILSKYLMKIHTGDSVLPQDGGLTQVSW